MYLLTHIPIPIFYMAVLRVQSLSYRVHPGWYAHGLTNFAHIFEGNFIATWGNHMVVSMRVTITVTRTGKYIKCIIHDNLTTTKQSTNPDGYFMGCTLVYLGHCYVITLRPRQNGYLRTEYFQLPCRKNLIRFKFPWIMLQMVPLTISQHQFK